MILSTKLIRELDALLIEHIHGHPHLKHFLKSNKKELSQVDIWKSIDEYIHTTKEEYISYGESVDELNIDVENWELFHGVLIENEEDFDKTNLIC